MNNVLEPILSALLTFLTNAVVVNFTATGASGTPNLSVISSTKGFFVGLPVFGPGVPLGAAILSFDDVAKTAVLDDNLTEASTTANFSTGFLTASRRAKMWQQVAEQPALFLRHTKNIDSYSGGSQQRTIIEVDVLVYSKAGVDPDVAADVQLNNLVDALREAVKPDIRGFPQTLASVNGGKPLVQWVRVEGDSDFDPGDLDDQGIAVLPLRILCP